MGKKETGGLEATRPPSGWSRFVSVTKMVSFGPAVEFSFFLAGGDSRAYVSKMPGDVSGLPAM